MGKYNYDYLIQHCKQYNITLNKDYNKEPVTLKSIIYAKCLYINCSEHLQKTFKDLLKTGCYCKTHIKKYKIEKKKKTCLEKYGVEHPLQSEEVKEKSRKTCIEKYGVEYSLQSQEVRDKGKETSLLKYGVENVSQSEEIKKLKVKTCLSNYGVENPSHSEDINDKKKQTCLSNYGVEHPGLSSIIKIKRKNTCLEIYGVENAAQNAEIAEKTSKNSYLSKTYTFPSGKEIKVQGYEPFALDKIIKTLSEDDIITGCSNVPNIAYADAEGKQHKHFPDIFILSQNKCIEVKSTWTAEKKKDNIFLKQIAGKQLGYNYEIWVYNRKGEKVNCYI